MESVQQDATLEITGLLFLYMIGTSIMKELKDIDTNLLSLNKTLYVRHYIGTRSLQKFLTLTQ